MQSCVRCRCSELPRAWGAAAHMASSGWTCWERNFRAMPDGKRAPPLAPSGKGGEMWVCTVPEPSGQAPVLFLRSLFSVFFSPPKPLAWVGGEGVTAPARCAQRPGAQHQEIPSAQPALHAHVTPSHRHAVTPPSRPPGPRDCTRCCCDASKHRVLFQSVTPVGFFFGLVRCFIYLLFFFFFFLGVFVWNLDSLGNAAQLPSLSNGNAVQLPALLPLEKHLQGSILPHPPHSLGGGG